MLKFLRTAIVLLILISLFSGCAQSPKIEPDSEKPGTVQDSPKESAPNEDGNDTNDAGDARTEENTNNNEPEEKSIVVEEIDLEKVKPNEAGKVMVVMFHNFIETYTSGDKEYTTTFDDFKKLLPQLYEKGYRLVNLNDFLDNNIAIPAGCIPMIFTFDDGTAGQFNLVEENGKLVANRQSAVGIIEEFNKEYPDFGVKGTFYVNLGLNTFPGQGTLPERLQYLVDKGFEIGNHTYTHINLKQTTSAEKIQQEIGGNHKKMSELIPGYLMKTFSLPYGLPSKDLQNYVVKGEYDGMKYENFAIMEVGWDPNVSPVSKKFNPLSIHRVRASGIKPVDADLEWWLKNLSRGEQYVSDGNPDTVTVPKSKEEVVDVDKLKGKKLITY